MDNDLERSPQRFSKDLNNLSLKFSNSRVQVWLYQIIGKLASIDVTTPVLVDF